MDVHQESRYPSLAAFFGEDRPGRASVAKKLGISESYLSLLVDGKRTPSLPLALRISKLTGVPVDALQGAK
jgi:transcriptional regulator with XRE-family HTH domain